MNLRYILSHRAALAIFLSCTLANTGAYAQSTDKPLKLIVPTSPGSSADIGARVVGDHIQKILNRIVIVENKLGAGGGLAAAEVASSKANGDTIGILGNSYLLYPIEFPLKKFDPIKDVVPVAMISRGANVLLVSSQSQYHKLEDIVRQARAEPGKITYASAGIGSSTFHSAERIRIAGKLNMLHIPYKGSPEAAHEVIGKRVDFTFVPISVALPLIHSGSVRALAVSPSKRSALLPQIPTTVEAGVPGSSYESWLAALVPIDTPKPIQIALNKAFNMALETPEVLERFSTQGIEPDPMSLEQLQAFVDDEYKKGMEHVKVVKNVKSY